MTQIDTQPAPGISKTHASAAPVGGLEVISIAKSYDKRAVLSDISLSVGKGEVLGLLGPNGAGKTTCFYSIMGLVRPDSAIAALSRNFPSPNSRSNRSSSSARVSLSGSTSSSTQLMFCSTVSPRKMLVSCGR